MPFLPVYVYIRGIFHTKTGAAVKYEKGSKDLFSAICQC